MNEQGLAEEGMLIDYFMLVALVDPCHSNVLNDLDSLSLCSSSERTGDV